MQVGDNYGKESTVTYKLPNGLTTVSQKKYVSEWRKLAKPFESLGWVCHSFDPTYTLIKGGRTVELTASFMADIGEALRQKNEA